MGAFEASADATQNPHIHCYIHPGTTTSSGDDRIKIDTYWFGGDNFAERNLASWPVPSGMDDGKWHHVAISFGNGNYRFYFDTQQAGSSSSSSVGINLVQTGGTPWCYVGRFRPTPVFGTCQSLGARIDRLRVYNRILSDSAGNNEIVKLYQQDIDSDGLWDITENRTRYSDYSDSVVYHPDPANPTAPQPTQTGYARSPFLHSSAASDFDQDELDDLAEQAAGTGLTTPDTDGDSLTDGFEVSNNFNPLNAYSLGATGPRDDLGDPDLDTLTTLTEYLNGSNPRNANSDGDGKNDAAEIAQGSDPTNAADSAAAPTDPPELVPFHINGDYTAWEATLKGKGPNDTRTRRFRMTTHNVTADQPLDLLRRNAYELSLRYIRTKPGETVPWYCWEASVAGQSAPAFTVASHWIVDNSSALLAGHTHSHGTNLVADKKVNLLPVEVISDLNNDGQITAADNPLRDAAMASGPTDEIKDKGTEFIFQNDTLSNGIWDKEDTDPARPATEKDDDDAEEITIKTGITEGEVWLDHPAIAKLSFYKTRECKPADKVNLSPTSKFTVSASNPFPDKLFMRADVDGAPTYPEADPQFAGDLVLKIKVGTNGQEIEAVKMKLTVVKQLGAKKYFHAARDYMFENNSKLCVRKESIGTVADPCYKRIVSMLQEKTEMKAVDSFHRTPKMFGIDAVTAGFSTYDVAVNGNFCYASDGRIYDRTRPSVNAMTDKCHGRLITGGVAQASSSTGGSSIYESSAADFIGWNSTSGIQIQTGVVPVSPATYTEALGGFGSNLLDEGGWQPWFGIANAGAKKVFFSATPYTVDGSGAGGRVELRKRLKDSGCTALPGGQPGEIQCIYGDGGSSLGLAYRVASSPFMTKLKGSKHTYSTGFVPQAGDYFINTYLLFKSSNPR